MFKGNYFNFKVIISIFLIIIRSSPRGVEANMLDYDVRVDEFELQSCYCILLSD